MPKPPKTSIPRAVQPLAYLGIRSVMAAAMVGSTGPTIRAAGALGRALARSKTSRRHMQRAIGNLEVAFPEWEPERRRECAIRSHEHLLMLGAEIAAAPRLLTEDGWPGHLLMGDISKGLRALLEAGPCILITGHCGNWELLGYTMALLGFPAHALYRPLDLPPLDRWVRGTRERRGLTLVDKFGAVRRLPELVAGGAPAAFVADQNGGDRGVFVPFFGRLTSTYKSIGLLALQFNATVVCGMARRLRPAERRGLDRNSLGFRVEMTDVFGPADWSAHPDPLFYLTARYRRSIEAMVRMAPEQYLWMHRIWRSRPRHERLGRPFPDALMEKVRLLPWITDADLARMVELSERDARTLAATGQSRLS